MPLGNLNMWEILIILAVILLVFGAKRLPEIGASMGKGIREFKRSITDVDRSLREPERDATADQLPAGDRAAAATDAEARPEPKRLLG